MDAKPKILYADQGLENFLFFVKYHFEDDSEVKMFIDSRLVESESAMLNASSAALNMTVKEFVETVVIDGKEIGNRWWTAYGLKWREGFNALEEGDHPTDEERPGGD